MFPWNIRSLSGLSPTARKVRDNLEGGTGSRMAEEIDVEICSASNARSNQIAGCFTGLRISQRISNQRYLPYFIRHQNSILKMELILLSYGTIVLHFVSTHSHNGIHQLVHHITVYGGWPYSGSEVSKTR